MNVVTAAARRRGAAAALVAMAILSSATQQSSSAVPNERQAHVVMATLSSATQQNPGAVLDERQAHVVMATLSSATQQSPGAVLDERQAHVAMAALSGAAPQSPGADWPQILGPHRNAAVDARVGAWSGDELAARWRRAVGEGFAGPVVVGDTVVLFHRVDDDEVLEAFDATSGASLWRTAYPTAYRDDFGFDEGPRATPTVTGGVIYSLGAQGVLQAVRIEDGRRLWQLDTHTRFGVRKGFFGAAGTPLVHDGRVMLNVGGRDNAGIVAFDAASGDVAWTATGDEASYAAPVLAHLGGNIVALFFTRAGLVEVDPANGAVRRRFPWRSRMGASVNAATPLAIGNRVFLSASYGTGAVLLEGNGDAFLPVWESDDAMTNHYATSVHRDGVLYGYHGRQEYRPALRAVDLETGAVLWTEERFGAGSIIGVDDRLLIVRENGELILAAATPQAFRPLARARILTPTLRAYPALANHTLYARNESELVAVELPREDAPGASATGR